jgi:hypothetical protein
MGPRTTKAGPSTITTAQLAEVLGVAVQTIKGWRWRLAAGLPLPDGVGDLLAGEIRIGRSVRYDAEAVDRWRRNRFRAQAARSAGGDLPALRAQAVALAEGLAGLGRHDLATVVGAVANAIEGVR